MNYQHRWLDFDTAMPGNSSKVVCVGRNYAAHASELNNPIPDAPIFFIKPSSALVNWQESIEIPAGRGPCHHELELAVVLNKPLTKANASQAADAIAGMSLALDLTLRDVQSELKAKGHPWEIAKAFDKACPVAPWLPITNIQNLKDTEIALSVNGEIRQASNTGLMLWPVLELVQRISEHFYLFPGDIILTGTPSGVSELCDGDRLEATLNQQRLVQSCVVVA